VLAVHLTVSIGWIGAVLAYIALGLAATNSTRTVTVRSAWVAMELIGWQVLIPLAVASLVTGILLGLGTKWGLVRYYWVLVSLVATCFATAVLVLHMPDVSALADRARRERRPELGTLGGDLFHATLGLLVLVSVLVLNMFKPPGLTRYGWRRGAR
jgi:hypothetical protein